jgi:hypothetical protein
VVTARAVASRVFVNEVPAVLAQLTPVRRTTCVLPISRRSASTDGTRIVVIHPSGKTGGTNGATASPRRAVRRSRHKHTDAAEVLDCAGRLVILHGLREIHHRMFRARTRGRPRCFQHPDVALSSLQLRLANVKRTHPGLKIRQIVLPIILLRLSPVLFHMTSDQVTRRLG